MYSGDVDLLTVLLLEILTIPNSFTFVDTYSQASVKWRVPEILTSGEI
ncbi:hypothetical protein [Paraburkholderia sp. 32]